MAGRNTQGRKIAGQALRVEALLRWDRLGPVDGGHDDLVGSLETPGVGLLEDPPAGGVGSWLEHRPEPASGVSLPESRHGGADRRGVVGEVLHDEHSSGLAQRLHAAADPLEAVEGRAHLVVAEPNLVSHGDGGEGVLHVVASQGAPPVGPEGLVAADDAKACGLPGRPDLLSPPEGRPPEAIGIDTARGCLHQRGHTLVVGAGHD